MKKTGKNIVKTAVITALIIPVLLFTVSCSQAVATVDGIAVKQEEVDDYVSFILSQNPEGSAGLTEEERRELEINILDSLLVVKLLEKYAEENNITVSREDVDMQMQSITGSYESQDAFQDDLEQKGIDRDFLESLVESQILQNRIYTEATAEVIVTQEQVKEYYEENLDTQFTTPERIRVSHILSMFPWLQDANIEENEQAKKEARGKLEFVMEQLEDGAGFGDMAREYSDDAATSADGGDLGFITRGQMVPEFEEAAFSLEVGEVSDIVETQFGYHLIKVFDRQEASVQGFEEARESISTYLSELKKMERWEGFVRELIEDADIEYLTDNRGSLNDMTEDTGTGTGETPQTEEGTESGEDDILDDENLEDFIEDQ